MEVDSYLKERNTQRGRRRRFLLFCAGGLGVGLLGIGIVWTMLNARIFTVKKFDVMGNKTTPTDSIRTFLDTKIITASLTNTLLGFQNIISWPEQSFDNYAPELPRVKRIVIAKSYTSRTVTVDVEERNPFGIWCAIATSTDSGVVPSCFWFDREGVLLDQAPQASGNLIAVVHDYTGKYLRSQTKVEDSRAMENLISVFDALDSADLPVKEVRLEDRDLQEVRVVLTNGPDIYFSLRFPADEAPSVIVALKKGGGTKNPAFSSLEYVDFRVEHHATYR
jgi:hypothetical protein